MAVSSDGHRLFASRADYRPELAGKVLKKRPWLMRDEPEFHPQVFPEWQQVLPTWAPEQLGRLRFRVPLGLAEFGREVILNLSEDRALFTREDEKPTCDRRIRAEKLAPIEGCEIAALWCHTDTVTQLTGATVFVPNQSETWMSPDFLKKQPWFMVVMPLRDLV